MKKSEFLTCRYKKLFADQLCLRPTVNGRECANHAPRLIWPQDSEPAAVAAQGRGA